MKEKGFPYKQMRCHFTPKVLKLISSLPKKDSMIVNKPISFQKAMNNNPFHSLSNNSILVESAKDEQKTNDQTQSFLYLIENQHCSSLIELAEVTEQILDIKPEEKDGFRKDFDKYQKQSKKDYDECLKKRLGCFEEKEDPDLIACIRAKLGEFDTMNLRPLLESINETLFQPEPHGYGGLFLLGLIVSHRPDLITPKLFSFPHEVMLKVAPSICWMIGHATTSQRIAHLDPLLSHQLLEIFLPELSNPKKESTALAICAAHLIYDAFEHQKVFRAIAYHYVKLLQLIHPNSNTYRDKQIADIFRTLVPKLDVVDKKDFAMQMFKQFPSAPDFACELFIKEATKENGGNASFVDGWIENHSSHKDASMNYLTKVLKNLPENVVNKFPMEDLIKGGDLAKLTAMKVQLTNSSFRFIFIICVIWAFMSFWKDKA